MAATALNLDAYDADAGALLNLHLAVEVQYVSTDFSLAQLIEREPLASSGINLRRVEAWCKQGGWVAQRTTFQKKWRDKILEEMGQEIADARRRDLRSLMAIQTDAVNKIRSGALEAKSYEGLIGAIVRLAKVVDDIQVKMLGDLPPPSSVTSAAPADIPTPQLTLDEALAAAKMLIAMRRRKIRDELAAEAATPAPQREKKPPPPRRKKRPPPGRSRR